jgi:tRNA(Ile)-lysidine synthase
MIIIGQATTAFMHDFEQQLAAAWPPACWSEVTVVVAVSGGPDSVALLRALGAIRAGGPGRLVAAHCNHRLRGMESEADAVFVAELSEKLRIPCEIGVAEVSQAADRGDGLEAAARETRYAFLIDAAKRHGARYVAAAHTADDQAETILYRIVRGTGLAGLAGIPRVRPLNELTTLIRPMLWARRGEVLDYLSQLGQDYRSDASNLEARFTRNRLRRELLPKLSADYNPAVVEALVRLGKLAGEAHEVLAAQAAALREQCAKSIAEGWEIDAGCLSGQPPYVVREMLVHLWRASNWPLQDMGLAEWERLAGMLMERSPQKQFLPGSVLVQWTAGGKLRLRR